MAEHVEDWTKHTDFTTIDLIGYLDDHFNIVQADILQQNEENGKILIRVSTNALYFGQKYEWLGTQILSFIPSAICFIIS